MRKAWSIRVFICLLLIWELTITGSVWCQNPEIQDRLSSLYKGKTLLLRNFYSGKELKFDQSVALLSGGVAGPWTLANMEIYNIVITSQGIEVTGNRSGTWYDSGRSRFVKIGKLRIDVSIRLRVRTP